jgi:hypothetical protein
LLRAEADPNFGTAVAGKASPGLPRVSFFFDFNCLGDSVKIDLVPRMTASFSHFSLGDVPPWLFALVVLAGLGGAVVYVVVRPGIQWR